MSKDKYTIAVHGGSIDIPKNGVNTPIYTSSAYDYEQDGETKYPRYANLTNQKVVADKIAKLEEGDAGLVFSSGMAAIMTTVLTFLSKGDHVIAQKDIYGGTFDAFSSELERFDIEVTFVKGYEIDAYREALKENTRLIYVETPSNPLLKIIDLEKIASLKSNSILTMVDNTFASPINQTPLTMGIDIVMHSATKYLGGHSDILGGAIVSRVDIVEKIKGSLIRYGGTMDPQTCYLLERSIKTLGVRVAQQNKNAIEIANFLKAHPLIKKVYYPGLADHDGHEVAKKQMSDFGGMLSFDFSEDAGQLIDKLKLIKRAVSLGGVESTVCLPALTSHSKVDPKTREEMGISDNLVRLSVGIESKYDLINDLKQAL